jgi:Tfp pilus tip-associated adhesin PilY1
MPAPYVSKLTFTSAGTVTSITVSGAEILSEPAMASNIPELAFAISNAINECTFGLAGACTTVGYMALMDEAGAVYIYVPKTPSGAVTPVVTGIAAYPTAFARPADNRAPGEIVLIAIHTGRATYPKDVGRTDCAGSECTYAEEMTNYANWWAYYRTRMLTMKTAASHAFAPIEDDFRVGFMSINNKTGTAQMGDFFLNIDTFSTAQKLAWYDKLFDTRSAVDYTPLRLALAQTGRLYAGQLKGTYNGHAITDPVQYSCQQNVSILSTDGYWNYDAGFMVNGTTPVGDQDGKDVVPAVERPQLDGGTPGWMKTKMRWKKKKTPTVATWNQIQIEQSSAMVHKLQTKTKDVSQWQSAKLQKTTSTLKSRRAPLLASTSQLQTRVGQVWRKNKDLHVHWEEDQPVRKQTRVKRRTATLQNQASTRTLQSRTRVLWQQPQTLRQYTYQLQRLNYGTVQQQTSVLQKYVSAQAQRQDRAGPGYGPWYNVDECTPEVGLTRCQSITSGTGIGAWQTLTSGSCTPQAGPAEIVIGEGTDSERVQVRTVVSCQYTPWAPASWENVASCTPIPQSTSIPNDTLVAVKCQNTLSGTENVIAPDTCTIETGVTGCQYATSPSITYPATTCTVATKSSGGNGSTWTVNEAVTCDYVNGTQVNNVTSCTPVPPNSGSANGTQYTTQNAMICGYTSPGFANAASCTPTGSTELNSGTHYGPVTECQYTSASGWTNVTGCTVTPSDDIDNFRVSVATVQCNVTDGWTDYSYVAYEKTDARCTGTGVECVQELNTEWQIVASCTSGFDGTTLTQCGWRWKEHEDTCPTGTEGTDRCRLDWSTEYRVDECTKVSASEIDASHPYEVDCRISGYTTSANSGWTVGVSTCTKTAQSNGPSYYKGAVECGYTTWTTPTDNGLSVGSCTPVDQSSGPNYNEGTATRCQYSSNWWSVSDSPSSGTWTPVGSCQEYTPPANDYSRPYAIQCSYDAVGNSPVTVDVTDGNCAATGSKDFNTGTVVECAYGGYTPWTDVPTGVTCTEVPESNLSLGTGLANQAVKCNVVWSGWVDVTACTAEEGVTECRYNPEGAWNAQFCNAETPGANPGSSPPNYTEPTRISACTTNVVQAWGPPLGGTELSDADLAGMDCNITDAAGRTVKCQPTYKNATEAYAVSCTPIPYDDTPEKNTVTCSQEFQGSSAGVLDPNCKSQETALPPEGDPFWDTAGSEDYWQVSCQELLGSPTPDTLADVAQYYYMTDLRTSSLGNCLGGEVNGVQSPVCENIVPPSGDSTVKWQHMVTYTLGLGASGLMQYQPDYLTAESGDFFSIKTGQTVNHNDGICTWQQDGSCNWPKPASGTQTNIDDLWHAAVNGRGEYYSASDPSSLAAGISSALASITAKAGSLTPVTFANPNLVVGKNALYSADFQAGEWVGNLYKMWIDGKTSEITETPEWSAQSRLDTKIANEGHEPRKIYAFSTSASNRLREFKWANLTTAEKAYFRKENISLSQFCTTGTICLPAALQTAASGEALFNYIRGDRTYEGAITDTGAYFRQRSHILGDIVTSQPLYVGVPPWSYADQKYLDFKASKSTRRPTIYVGANDGMLHAFDDVNGQEKWAYVPSMVVPNLHKLADKFYSDAHRYYVDGSPVMGDICASGCNTDSAVWKTILVGGLNNGGRGYYALDVTDPDNPRGLWEFTDDNLGKSFGNPLITKLSPDASHPSGRWVVIVASGYNNIPDGVLQGDGEGRLFILDASTGAIIRTISTGEGSTVSPSGLSRITGWATYPEYNNQSLRVYGGDLLGNVWRFDINGNIPLDPPSHDAKLIATLKDDFGNAQPIMTHIELGKIKTHSVLFIGTGQLLGTEDLVDTKIQSIYAIRDNLTGGDGDSYGDPRTSDQSFVRQTMVLASCPAGNDYCTEGDPVAMITTVQPVDFNVNAGWYVDFPAAGERANVDMHLARGTLSIVTNTPEIAACVPIGRSAFYFLNYLTGGYIPGTNGVVGINTGNNFSNSPTPYVDATGNVRVLRSADCSGPSCLISEDPPDGIPGLGTRRTSWRELVSE